MVPDDTRRCGRVMERTSHFLRANSYFASFPSKSHVPRQARAACCSTRQCVKRSNTYPGKCPTPTKDEFHLDWGWEHALLLTTRYAAGSHFPNRQPKTFFSPFIFLIDGRSAKKASWLIHPPPSICRMSRNGGWWTDGPLEKPRHANANDRRIYTLSLSPPFAVDGENPWIFVLYWIGEGFG